MEKSSEKIAFYKGNLNNVAIDCNNNFCIKLDELFDLSAFDAEEQIRKEKLRPQYFFKEYMKSCNF